MSRPKGTPAYRLHKPSGKAVVTLTDPSGRRQDVYLGNHGTEEAYAEYLRVIAEWRANGKKRRGSTDPKRRLTVAELLARFWEHAEVYYGEGVGKQTSELQEFRMALRPLNFLFGKKPARKSAPRRQNQARGMTG